jgi:ribosome-binding protein aMBF1 (putative translation factor)
MKCDICKKEIGKIFLGKILGTYVKFDKKKYAVCSECQKRYKTEKELKNALK